MASLKLLQKNEKSTKELFLDTLAKIGCSYTIDEEDDGISFSFQGETFVAWIHGDFYISIWDYFWKRRDLHDIDNLSQIKRLINEANTTYGITTIYSIEEEDNLLSLHCKVMIPFIAQIPQLDDYLKIELNQFFRVHRFIDLEEDRRKNLLTTSS